MSWLPMNIPPYPFSFSELPEFVEFENYRTEEVVRYFPEHREIADNLRHWNPHESFDNDRQGEVQIRILYQMLGLGGAMMMDGADAAVAVRDRLIELLEGEK